LPSVELPLYPAYPSEHAVITGAAQRMLVICSRPTRR
jgi:hypothetical protein